MTKPKIDLSELSIEELERELARRRAKDAPLDMTAMELAVEMEEKVYGRLALQERLDQLEARVADHDASVASLTRVVAAPTDD